MTVQPDEDSGRTAGARPSISKTLRFEVFKRDSFTCQYCGRRAPDIILHCDHVKAVAEGGTTDILNLVTACVDCNLGKGARKLSENAALSKQLNQLAALQEKREQMDMMLAWHDELNELDEMPLLELEKRWNQLTGYWFSDDGKKSIRKLIKRCGFDVVAAAMKVAADQHLQKDDKGDVTDESVERTFDFVGRIANVERAERLEPGSKQMFYIRGILRNRLIHYCPESKALTLIKEAAQSGVPLDLIAQIAKNATSWTVFRTETERAIDDADEAHADDQWRAIIREALEVRFGLTHATAALDLFCQAVAAGMSQARLLNTADNCFGDWEKYRKWLEPWIDFWTRVVSPFQSVLGGQHPDDDTIGLMQDVLDLGVSQEAMLAAAAGLRNWPHFVAWLEQRLWQEPTESPSMRSDWVPIGEAVQRALAR